MRTFTASVLVVLLFVTNSYAQCPPDLREIRLQINTDLYWDEVHWWLTDEDTDELIAQGSVPDSETHEFTYCTDYKGCLKFSIFDSGGDAMTPDGWYRLYLDSVLVRESIGVQYLAQETTVFGCPPGVNCQSSIQIDTGYWAIPDGKETWYKFVPVDTGMYEINTCDSLNACGSKIWVYGQCEGLNLTDNIVGADFYAADGCDNGALATLFLAGGNDYYIRIRSEPDNCDTIPIHFRLKYIGPIVGCTDPISCNYEPLATIAGDCIYPGDPDCNRKPDLFVSEFVLKNSLMLSSEDVSDACAVQEGCVRGFGIRTLLKFNTYIGNMGELDYYIGPTPSNPNTPSTQFVWDLCHHHWHYEGYAEYLLFDEQGTRIPIGSKTGFCVIDLVCPTGIKKYNCGNMGISAGCADVYDTETYCQWVDITDIPAGTYTLVVRTNWDKSPDAVGRLEETYDNNWAQACFNLTYDNGLPEVMLIEDPCLPYTDCAGVVFGSAQPDCNGICNGPALPGDINQDTLRNMVDVEGYLTHSNNNTGDPSTCLDLDANGFINVYDAALLQECALHENDLSHWYQEFPCQFPAGFVNIQDNVVFALSSVDTTAKTIDLAIINPFNEILAYEFSISGALISSVQNQATEFHPSIKFNPSTGEIVALGTDESSIAKHGLPSPFLRIHYSELNALEVCLDSITAVVNKKYQLSNAAIASPSCLQVKTSGIVEATPPAFRVFVQPNPFGEQTNIFFENPSAEAMRIELWDINGQLIKAFDEVRSQMVTLERAHLPSGIYYFSIKGPKGVVNGKIVAN